MNRRRALLVIGAAAFSGVGQASSALVRLLQSGLSGKQVAASTTRSKTDNQAADDRLRKDLARLDARVNSEEGVPVFLGCINLVANKNSPEPAAVTLTAFNAAVAADFRQTAAAWERLRPNSTESDVAHVIEVLAYRDFSGGGKEQRS